VGGTAGSRSCGGSRRGTEPVWAAALTREVPSPQLPKYSQCQASLGTVRSQPMPGALACIQS
jgi:hypothetical protein